MNTVTRNSVAKTVAVLRSFRLLISIFSLRYCGESNSDVIRSTKAITANKEPISNISKGKIISFFTPVSSQLGI